MSPNNNSAGLLSCLRADLEQGCFFYPKTVLGRCLKAPVYAPVLEILCAEAQNLFFFYLAALCLSCSIWDLCCGMKLKDACSVEVKL